MRQFMASPGVNIPELLRRMAATRHPIIVDGVALLQKEIGDRVRTVWSEAAQWLAPWDNPTLAANMSDTTIPWRHLQDPKEPLSFYLRVAANDAKGWLKPVVRLICDVVFSQLMADDPDPNAGKCLALLDDASEIGFLPIVETIATYGREYGLYLMILFQSPMQMWRHYGEYTSLFDACGAWVIYRQNHPMSAELIAKKLGDRTVADAIQMVSAGGLGGARVSEGPREHSRKLLDAGEIGKLKPGEVILCIRDLNIKGTWENAYLDPLFRMPRRAA
jgi:type IV secretory pathway TraG/TraD family ATPase VirD4